MRPLSRREGIWVEASELDLADDVGYASETFVEVLVQAAVSTEETCLASEGLVHNQVSSLSDGGIASTEVTGLLTAPPLTDTVAGSDALAVPVFLTGSVDTVAASDALSYDDAAVTQDTATLADALVGVLAQVSAFADTGIARDSDAALFSGVSSDTVIASDALASLTTPVDVVDTLAPRDGLVAVVAASQATVDTGIAAVGLTSEELVTWADTLVASDGVASAATAAQQDAARVAETLGGALVITSALSDGAAARDELSDGSIGVTADTATASDGMAGTVAVYAPSLADTVTATDLPAGPVAVYAPALADTASAADSGLSGGVVLVGVMADTVLAGDTLSDEAYSVVVVTNAETGAVSTYTMTPTVAGLAQYRGTLYLAGPDGLYAMDATEDPTGAVVWTLRTGFSNLGDDRLKQVRDVNVQGRTEGGLTLQAVIDRYGQKQEYHYVSTALTRNAYRDGVIKLGRGLQSVYWELGLQGEGPAEVDQLLVAVEPLSRRR